MKRWMKKVSIWLLLLMVCIVRKKSCKCRNDREGRWRRNQWSVVSDECERMGDKKNANMHVVILGDLDLKKRMKWSVRSTCLFVCCLVCLFVVYPQTLAVGGRLVSWQKMAEGRKRQKPPHWPICVADGGIKGRAKKCCHIYNCPS
jgi:hypothetical protein